MIGKIVRYAGRSRWHLFMVLCLFSWSMELPVLFFNVGIFTGMFVGSLATAAVLATTDKRKLFRRKASFD